MIQEEYRTDIIKLPRPKIIVNLLQYTITATATIAPRFRHRGGQSGFSGAEALQNIDPPTPTQRDEKALAEFPHVTEFVFTWVFTPPKDCKGSYRVRLTLNTGGQVSGGMLKKAVGVAVTDQTEKGQELVSFKTPTKQLGQAPRLTQMGDKLIFDWPERTVDCGPHEVTVNPDVAAGALPGDYTFVPEQHSEVLNVKENERLFREYKSSLVSKKPPEQVPEIPKRAAPEAEAAEGTPQSLLAEMPSVIVEEIQGEQLPGGVVEDGVEVPDRTTSDLAEALMIAPEVAEVLSVPQVGVGVVRRVGPPWTQMDILLDSGTTVDASHAIGLHDIEGPNIVRGHFDGRMGAP